MNKCLLGIAVFSAIVLLSCAGVEPIDSSKNTQSTKTIQKDLSAQEFNNASKGLLLDVRTPEEFVGGNIVGSQNLNIYDANFSTEIDKLDKNVPVYVYCRSGTRSRKASEMMKQKGFKEVYNLKGGYSSYSFK